MEQELEQKIARIIRDRRSSVEAGLWIDVAKDIVALIQPQSPVVDKGYEIVEWKSSRRIWYRCAYLDGNKNYPQYALENMESVRNTGPHMIGYPEEFQINAIKTSTGEVYRLNDKIVWNWEVGGPEYLTIKAFAVDEEIEGKLKFQIVENNDQKWYKWWQLTHQMWNLRHYQESPVEKVEPKELTVTISMREYEKYILWKIAQEKIKKGVKKCQEVILRTEDGVDIIDKHQRLYGVLVENWMEFSWEALPASLVNNHKWFSTEAARDQYIMMNKSIYSITDIEDKITGKGGVIIERLIREQKEKLKQ